MEIFRPDIILVRMIKAIPQYWELWLISGVVLAVLLGVKLLRKLRS